MPLQRCQRETTSTEFLEWVAFMEREDWQEISKSDYYLAAIRLEIKAFRESFMKSPRSLSMQDALLKFDGQKKEKEEEENTQEPVVMSPALLQDKKWEAVTANAKANWFAFAGLGPDGKPKAGENGGAAST